MRVYVNYQQNNWSEWFSMIEYVFDALNLIFTKLSSFFVNYRFESRVNFELIKINDTTRKKILKQKTTNIHTDMKKIWLFAKKHFDQTRANQKKYANKNKKKIPQYQTKNKIWLSTKNIKIERFSKKLNDKQLKSFEMIASKNNTVKFKLQNFMKIHNNFHIFLLRKNPNNLLFNQIEPSSSFVVIDNETEWKINDILNFRRSEKNRKLQYRANWMNHSFDKKWYDAVNFNNAKNIVVEFHARYSNKSN